MKNILIKILVICSLVSSVGMFNNNNPTYAITQSQQSLVDKFGNVKGYITGAKLFNNVGLTTQVPNVIDIVTNECKNNNKYENKYLNVIIRKPKIEINNENYKYLQLIDLIENKDNIYIEVDSMDEILYNFIQENSLDFEKIIKYARQTNSKAVIEKMVILAR